MQLPDLPRLIKVLCLALLVTPSAQAATKDIPAFQLPTDSGTVSLAALKGKVVYVDFWASWCAPCRKSFPWMNEMQRRYGQAGLAVVAINVDKDRALAEQFLASIPANFTIAYDPQGSVAEQFHVEGMPSSFIISRDGALLGTHIGFRDDDAVELERVLKTTLAR
jgi:thiol-disulfide isomerase/thioredoxin